MTNCCTASCSLQEVAACPNLNSPLSQFDPLAASIDLLHPTKNTRVPQPRHCHLPTWLPPNESISTTMNTNNKMLILHPKNTFLRDDQVADNVYNSSLCNSNAWTCVECLKVFYMRNRLKLHYVLEHNVRYCHLCDVFIDGQEQEVGHRQRIHEGKTCDFCYVLVNDADLSEHHRSAHDVASCPYCLAYIRPTSELSGHITNTHRLKVAVDDPDLSKMFEQTGRESFRCFLCAENRKKELTGHFNIYHRVHTYILVRYFLKYKVDVTLIIEGPPYGPTKNVACEVCNERIPEVVPTEFHIIYCRHQFHCSICSTIFQTADALKSHNDLLHERHPCKLGCTNMAYNSAQNRTKHYFAYHKREECHFCDDMVGVEAPNAMNKHIKMTHACKRTNWGDTNATLIELALDDDSDLSQLNCLLCNDIIASTSPNEVYLHFFNDHNVVSHKLLTSIGGNLLTNSLEAKEDDIANNTVEEHEAIDAKDLKDASFPPIFDEKLLECLFEFTTIICELDTKCELCPKEFGSQLQYVVHLCSFHNLNIPKKYLKCDECFLKNYRAADHLLNHFKHYIEVEDHGEGDINFICNLCNTEIRLLEASDHYKIDHNNQRDSSALNKYGYKCRFCKMVFWKVQNRDRHEIGNHFNTTNITSFYTCHNCNKHFSSHLLLRNHKTCCDVPYENASILYRCLKCSMVMPTLMDSTKHFEEHHGDALRFGCLDRMCTGSFKDRRIAKRHYRTVHSSKKIKERKQYLCNICGQSFFTRNSLGGHKHVHTTEKRMFKCTVCPERFMTKSIRNHHVQAMHAGVNNLKCPDCEEMFQSRTALSMHRSTHGPQLQCSYCQKEFSRRDSFKEHILIHEGPRHQCPHCPRAFTQMSNLRRHLRIHTGEKPYKCAFCEKTFSDNGACKSHTSIHTREQECSCDICGKKYTKKQKLRYHMKTHTGEDMHPCHICNKKFVGRYALRVHLTCHEDGGQASVFVCDLCSKECKNKGSLTNHRKRCTGISEIEEKKNRKALSNERSVKRKYVKKKFKQKMDNDGPENRFLEYFPMKSSENDSTTTKNLIPHLEISEILVASLVTSENKLTIESRDKNKSNAVYSKDAEDNVSIIKLKNALIDKINSAEGLPDPRQEYLQQVRLPRQLLSRREQEIGQHLPNKDIIKSDVLDKVAFAIKSCSAQMDVTVKKENATNYKEEFVGNPEEVLQFVSVKIEPKEEQMSD